MQLTNDEAEEVRYGLAVNPNMNKLPEEVLTQLVNDESDYVLENLLWNPMLPMEIMFKCANSDNVKIRYYIAGNKNLPKKLMLKLANDPDKRVRDSLVFNRNIQKLPKEAIMKLAKEDPMNRWNLAQNPNIDRSILEI
jgi:hypothetical protein